MFQQCAGKIAKISFTSLATLLLSLNFSAIPAGATTLQRESELLNSFRINLIDQAEIARFDALSPEQQHELAQYLAGEIHPFDSLSAQHPQAGNFEIQDGASISVGNTKATPLAATASLATKTISAWQSYVFAGITISKTTVRETYTVSGANAVAIVSYSCIVDANYDPFAEVSSTKDGAWVSSGKATAECLVTVKRGTPTPWGQITWSTNSNIQFVTGNGYGGVTSHGWR